MSMDPTIKQEWVAALRSGQYRQGRNYLRREDIGQQSYCCLGVLCELAVEAGVLQPPIRQITPNLSHTVYRYNGSVDGSGDPTSVDDFSGTGLPAVVLQWAGFTEGTGPYPEVPLRSEYPNGTVETTSLSVLNDDGKPFSVIADLIEEYL